MPIFFYVEDVRAKKLICADSASNVLEFRLTNYWKLKVIAGKRGS